MSLDLHEPLRKTGLECKIWILKRRIIFEICRLSGVIAHFWIPKMHSVGRQQVFYRLRFRDSQTINRLLKRGLAIAL
jgi:hypothetical protein